jgi:hypothetical protein
MNLFYLYSCSTLETEFSWFREHLDQRTWISGVNGRAAVTERGEA